MHSQNDRCKKYISEIESVSREKGTELTSNLKDDIIRSFIIFGSSPSEYFLFNFPDRTLKERDEFITDAHRTQVQKKIIGLDLFKNELIDKYKFYLLNSKFFKRDCVLVSQQNGEDIFREFLKHHNEAFLKLNAGSFGLNAHSYTNHDEDGIKEEFKYLELDKGAEWIVEELVVQDERMAVWNSSSVNTVRIPSFISNDKQEVRIFRPFIRTGRAGAMVDNAGAGGIFAVIDEVSGKIITDGADESFNRYICHPDSKIIYRDWQIPEWNKLIELVEKAHKSMPHHKYIAYDFALTPKGWVMIEGNWGQYVCQQTATQTGAKRRFLELMKM